MNKSDLKSQYDEYTSEYLLQLRARGDGLSDIAHAVIEELIESRGEPVPPKPKLAVSQKTTNKNQHILNFFGWAFLLFGLFILNVWLKSNLLLTFIYSFAFVIYLLYRWNKKRKLSIEEIAREDALSKIGKNGYTELMFYASEGGLERVKDLVSYTNEINMQDNQGGTALMHASKNGHETIVEFLLKAKASRELKTKSGSTALDFAKRGGHEKIVRLLSS